MSGIYIPGMEMPKDCPMCPLSNWDFTGEFRGCKAVKGKRYAMETEPEYCDSNYRPPWCPLVPVPPHGRLIDADALNDVLTHLADNEYSPKVFARWLSYEENAPTIIEAEEGE